MTSNHLLPIKIMLFITAILALALFPCHGTETITAAVPIKIGFLLKTMREERYERDRQFFTEKAESLGATVLFKAANNDKQLQIAQFQEALTEGAQVIVLQPVNTNTAGEMVKMAHLEGVRVIGYDSMLVGGPLDAMIMQNSWAVGKLQGDAMLDWLKKKGMIKGKVALIKGHPGDNNAEIMSQGAIKIIRENPGLEMIIEKSHEGWSPDKALATTEQVLAKHGKIDVFICNNSGLARGVIAALDAKGWADTQQVFVAGSDADRVNIRYIAQGQQSVEVWKKIQPLAEVAAEIAIRMANEPWQNPKDFIKDYPFVKKDKIGEWKYPGLSVSTEIFNDYMNVPTIVTPVELITKDNIDNMIIAGVYTKEQVYGK